MLAFDSAMSFFEHISSILYNAGWLFIYGVPPSSYSSAAILFNRALLGQYIFFNSVMIVGCFMWLLLLLLLSRLCDDPERTEISSLGWPGAIRLLIQICYNLSLSRCFFLSISLVAPEFAHIPIA